MRASATWIMAIWSCAGLCAAELPNPPLFGRSELAAPSEAVGDAWMRWDKVSRDFERQALAMPRNEGRERVRQAYAAMLEYLDARRIYGDAVSTSLDSHAHAAAITLSAVSSDQLDLLGAQLSEVQKRLEGLRNAPEWITIRRGVQKQRDVISKLQDSRRDRIPDSLLWTREQNKAITASGYKESDHEVRMAIEGLWTHYCQTLLDVIYQQPEGSTSPEVQLAGVNERSVEPAQKSGTRLEGAWTYIENSRKFEGAAEPKHVVLELWEINGQLTGRYRADLQDKEGLRHLDLRLTGKPGGRKNQTLAFRSSDPPATGTVTLQPSSNGMELMFIRPSGVGGVPGGKELLTRR